MAGPQRGAPAASPERAQVVGEARRAEAAEPAIGARPPDATDAGSGDRAGDDAASKKGAQPPPAGRVEGARPPSPGMPDRTTPPSGPAVPTPGPPPEQQTAPPERVR